MTALSFQRGGNLKVTLTIGQSAKIVTWLEERGILNYTINDDLTIDIEGSVTFSEKMKSFPSFIRFNNVSGSFSCRGCGLTTLKGSPRVVEKLYDCSLNRLTSMKGGPEKVGSLVCIKNNLSSFEYFPIIKHGLNIRGNKFLSLKGIQKNLDVFYCNHNLLTSLEGAPEVKDRFDCSDNLLLSLEYEHKITAKNFDCSHNLLKSLKGLCIKEIRYFDCSDNYLTSLKYGPEIVFWVYDCSHNRLKSLKGAPKISRGNFHCEHNKLKDLTGAPERVTQGFRCSYNHLTSLTGAPKVVLGGFDCSNNKLNSLEGSGIEKIKGNFYCYKNKVVFTEEYVRKNIPNIEMGKIKCSSR